MGISCQKTMKPHAFGYISKEEEDFFTTPTYLAQMASTVARHIVLSQGCAAADVEETYWRGRLSATLSVYPSIS